MKQFAISFWIWMPATLKAVLMSMLAMATAFTGYVKNPESINTFTKGDWIFCSVLMFISGGTVIVAFLDQSIKTIQQKAGDTMLFYKNRDRDDIGGPS